MNLNLYFLKGCKLWQGLIMFQLFVLIFLFQSNPIHATHIVGGQLTYKNVGKNLYEITIVFRRDCFLGADTVYFDDPALLGVFYGDRQKAFRVGKDGVLQLPLMVDDTLSETIETICVGKFQEVCVHQTIYRDTVYLPFDERGYTLTYQRCCRNSSLTNIEEPLETGSTYTVNITPANLINANSGPAFGNFPPIYICTNKPFIFDNHATDINGDSLVYELCAPYKGKTRLFPAGRPFSPPYDTVVWKSPFNINNLVGSPMTIDPKTGIITAMPQILGQFLVGVCVYEYRFGKLIGIARRDFELNVVPCGFKPKAAFERTSPICDGLKVDFKNLSTDGIDFIWYFDWQNDKSLNSKVFSPSFTYSKEGSYEVILVTRNGDCDDTTRLLIKVVDPQLKPDFDFTVNCQSVVSLNITDQSTSNGKPISYLWKLTGARDTLTSNGKDPSFVLTEDGAVSIELTIRDTNGCTASIIKSFVVSLIEVNLLGDPTICSGDSTRLVNNPNPLLTYQWNPKTSLDLSDPSNPIARPTNTTTYTVTITDGLCSAVKQITVNVKERVDVLISGDSVTCDSIVDITATSTKTTEFIWSFSPNFDSIIFTGSQLITTISGTKTFYVKAGRTDQCQDSASITVSERAIHLNYAKEYSVCTGDTFTVHVVSSNPADHLIIDWLANPIIISARNILSPTVSIPAPGKYVLYFTVTNQFGCAHSDSVTITAIPLPIPAFSIENECGSLTIKVNTLNKGMVIWNFGDAIGSSTEKTTSYTYTKPGKYIITLEIDSICISTIQREITVVDLKTDLGENIVSCFGKPVHLNPGGNSTYKYSWTPTTGLNDPNSPDPIATVSTSTKYYVIVRDPNFPDVCFITDSILVIVPPLLTLQANRDTVLCERTRFILTANVNLGGIEFEWYDAFNNPLGKTSQIEVNPDKSSFYVVNAIDTFGCSLTDTVYVQLFELLATLSGPDNICIGDSALIRVIAGPGTNYSYEWSPTEFIIGSNRDSVIRVRPVTSTTFTVKISNDRNCTWELSKTINVNNPQNGLDISADPETIVAGQKTQLTATFNPGWSYLWKPQDGSLSDSSIYNPIANPLVTTTYTVTVTDNTGCTGTDVVTVTVQTCDESIFIPNAFSPNNDRANDILFVRTSLSTLKMELVIYNRWGEKVFSTTDKDKGWDGRLDGEGDPLPPDVFGYGLTFTCPDNREYVKKGNVSIIK